MRWVALALLITLGIGSAEDGWIVEPTRHFTKRVVLVLDVSGSMNSRLDVAVAAAVDAMAHPVDELELFVIAFDSRATADPTGWFEMPNPEQLERSLLWAKGCYRHGDTAIRPALRLALSDAVRRDEMSILIISDGRFSAERVVDTIRAAQDVVIGCYGIGEPQQALVTIAELGGGGYRRFSP